MRVILVLTVTALLVSCASRKGPAPIADIENAPGVYTDQYRNTLAGDIYTVKKGETLYSIAFRAGIDFRQLAQMNGIKRPYSIFPGQQIKLKPGIRVPTQNSPTKQTVIANATTQKNNKKTIANEKSEEYGKKQQDQKDKKLVKKDPFPNKVRKWRYPSEGKIIETYSARENGNKGLDFGGNAGDPIKAAADGKVVYAGSALRGYGNLVIVKHNNDYLSAYAHNRVLKVKEQDWVKAGQVIAEMGKSGSDTVRLHFEIRFRGRSVNPLKYLPKR